MNLQQLYDDALSWIRKKQENDRRWNIVLGIIVLLIFGLVFLLFNSIFIIFALIPGYEKVALYVEPIFVVTVLISIPVIQYRLSRSKSNVEEKDYPFKGIFGVPAFVIGVFIFWFIADTTGRVNTFPLWDSTGSDVVVNWWVVSILGILLLYLGPIAINKDFEKRPSRVAAQLFGFLVMLHLAFPNILDDLFKNASPTSVAAVSPYRYQVLELGPGQESKRFPPVWMNWDLYGDPDIGFIVVNHYSGGRQEELVITRENVRTFTQRKNIKFITFKGLPVTGSKFQLWLPKNS